MSYIPSADQIQAQLRIAIPALGTLVTALGAPAAEASSWTQTALLMVAPISYLVVAVWTGFANTREAYMRKASKPVAEGVPAPKIILPPQEKALADKLPDNVISARVAA
jgi:hypothetical protein